MKALTNYRYYVLLVLAVTAVIGLLSEPTEGLTPLQWNCAFYVSKIIGFVSAYAVYRLASHWQKQNKLKELNDLFNNIQ